MPIVASENWLPVTGWDGFYEVSDLGNVRSLRHRWGLRPQPRRLKQKRGTHGRFVVILSRHGDTKTRLVHHLVLEAFIGPRPPGQEARHGPGGMLDNRLANLCWGTHSENVGADKLRDGTSNRGERHGMAKLTEADVKTIRERRAAGESQAVLAREFGIHPAAVSRIVTRQAWVHV